MNVMGFEGDWLTDFGPLTIELEGNQVKGKYGEKQDGILKGFVVGPILTGKWNQPAASELGITWGDCTLTLEGVGNSFTGKWKYKDNAKGEAEGTWNGKRKNW